MNTGVDREITDEQIKKANYCMRRLISAQTPPRGAKWVVTFAVLLVGILWVILEVNASSVLVLN